jgi:hypothetical protein
MATMQHPDQRTVVADIEPGAVPRVVFLALLVPASGRG